MNLDIVSQLRRLRVVPIITIDDADNAVALADALAEGGLSCLEVTFRTPAAGEALRRIARQRPTLLIGAGTVLTPEQAALAKDAGARFVLSPGLNRRVVAWCQAHEMPIFPGVCTPTDIEMALEQGLDVVKVFPAAQIGGLPYLRAIAAPFPGLGFMPTGGINAANVAEYLAYDRVVACGGLWMAPQSWIAAGDFDRIRDAAREAVGRGARRRRHELTMATRVVVTLGEIMLRLKSPGHERLLQSPAFEATFGGAESNVAVSLVQYGMQAAFVTVLPANPIGDAAITELRRVGVDTRRIRRAGDRVGIYYLEAGAAQRPSKVVYDRAGSSIAVAKPGDFDWDAVFAEADWFHISGITPAISASGADLALEAVRQARAKNIAVSCDYNYRNNLWKYGKKAPDVMRDLVKLVQVGIANEEDCQQSLGIASRSDAKSGHLDTDTYRTLAERVLDAFPNLEKQVITLRESRSADHNVWAACLHNRDQFILSRRYDIPNIVDRVGSGDAFAGGVIYGLLTYGDDAKALEFATAAGCLKHSVPGDFNMISLTEVERLMQGDGSGRVQR